MNPTRYEPERSNIAMVAHPEGRFVLYADAEKWVRGEMDSRKLTATSIAKLHIDNENMAKLNDLFPKEIMRLKDEIALFRNERDEALRKSALDQKQCDEMTFEAAGMAEVIAKLKESFNKERARRCQCEFDGGEYFPCKYHGKKDEQIAVLTKFKKAVENEVYRMSVFRIKETERETEIAALKEKVKEYESPI